ncbi:MAG: class I SAM-dependent methyltransferase [Bacteroidales bacterium]
MQYDPIKAVLGKFFNRRVWLRKLFYRLLDTLLLRTWHVHQALRVFFRSKGVQARVLDAGSGFGQYSWYIASRKPQWDITGIEIKEEQVQDCNMFFARANRSNARFELGDLTRYMMPEHFDLILSVDVMEHIEEDVTVFRNFYHSLKPGGELLISTPSDQGGSGVEHEHDSSFIEEHVRDGYSPEEITGKLHLAGFEKVDVKYTYGWPGKISWKFSMKYPILLLGVSRLFFVLLPVYYLLVFPGCLLLNYLDIKLHHQRGTGLLVRALK